MKTKEIEDKIEKILRDMVREIITDGVDKPLVRKSIYYVKTSEITSTLRQSVLEEVREKMPKKKEYQKPLAVHLIDRVYDCDVSSFNDCLDQVTSLINNLIEEKK